MSSTNGGDIRIINCPNDIEQIENKIHYYFAIAMKLDAFNISSKLVIENSGHTQYRTFDSQICVEVNKKVPHFCYPGSGHKHAVFRLTTDEAAIHILLPARKIIGPKGQCISNVRKVYISCIRKAFEQLVSQELNAPEDAISKALNAQRNVEVYQADWFEFVKLLENCLKSEFKFQNTCFLYYVFRNKLVGGISQTIDELKRLVTGDDYDQSILFYELKVGALLTAPDGNAIFCDLERIHKRPSILTYHIDSRYGYFNNLTELPDSLHVTFISMYNGYYYDEQIRGDFCPLTGLSLLGQATAFQSSDTLIKRTDDMLNWLQNCINKMGKCIPAKIEATVTMDKLSDINVHNIHLKVNDILAFLTRRKILVFSYGCSFNNYVREVEDNFNYAIELYYGLEKPATKQSLSSLYYAENEFIWSLERSDKRCNEKRIGHNLSEDIIQDLEETDLRSRFIQSFNIKDYIQRVYRNLPRTDWRQFSSAVNMDEKINKEYVILQLYAAFGIECISLTVYHGEEDTKYCPFHCLKIECCNAHNPKSPLSTPVTSHDVAERIIYPVTTVGRVITSFVYERSELNEATVDKMDSFIMKNGINVFPTVLLEGYENGKNLCCWSPINNNSVKELVAITPSKFYGPSASESFIDETEQFKEIEDDQCNICLGFDSSSSFDLSLMFMASSKADEHSNRDDSNYIDNNDNGDEQEKNYRCLCENSSAEEEDFDFVDAMIKLCGDG